MRNKLSLMNESEVLAHRRRDLSEGMILSCIAFKRDKNSDQRLLSGSRYDSIIERLREIRMNKFMDYKQFINRGDA